MNKGKINLRKVVKLTKNGRYVATFKSVQHAGKKCAHDVRNIYKCCIGKKGSTQGYRWMFQDDYFEARAKYRYYKVETQQSLISGSY